MLGAQPTCRTICGAWAFTDHTFSCRPISSSHCYSSRIQFFLQPLSSRNRQFIRHNHGKLKSFAVISCKSSFGSFSHKSDHEGEGRNHEDRDVDDYVEAIILISVVVNQLVKTKYVFGFTHELTTLETLSHYRLRMHGFQEDTSWQSTLQLGPFSIQRKDPIVQVNHIGSGFLRRFQNPTIFLKISCDGDFVLPISVGEYAVEKLVDSFDEEEIGDCPNQFQLVRNLTEKLGYQVKMVKITKRVGNTYYARICLHKPGEKTIFSVDARPSDAINVAKRCKAPIYVNKQIVLADATRIRYGRSRISNKPIYDVSLDSAPDGPDLLSEELNLVRNMNLATDEERYSDAAMWRDKLVKLRESK